MVTNTTTFASSSRSYLLADRWRRGRVLTVKQEVWLTYNNIGPLFFNDEPTDRIHNEEKLSFSVFVQLTLLTIFCTAVNWATTYSLGLQLCNRRSVDWFKCPEWPRNWGPVANAGQEIPGITYPEINSEQGVGRDARICFLCFWSSLFLDVS